MKNTFMTILALTAITVLASCTGNTGSRRHLTVIESANLQCNDSILVFEPEHLTDSTPALYLLHGWSGNYRNWSDKYDLEELAQRTGFIIICPDGFYSSWYLDSPDTTKMQWRKFFHNELYPAMAEKYGLSPERTFITGLSMGGHGAINIFIDDTSRFAGAGSMSGVLNLHHTPLAEKWISPILGDYATCGDRYTSESATTRATLIKGCRKPLIICCGYDDIYDRSLEEFAEICRKNDINHIEIHSKGRHEWKYWCETLELQMWLFGRQLQHKLL